MFESAFASAPTGVALIAMDGRFLRVNHALCVLLDRSADELVGSTSEPFTHPEDPQITDAAWAHLNHDGTPLAVAKRYLRPDGEVVWASTIGQTVKDPDGAPRYVVSHFMDVSAVKIAEQGQREASTLFETAFADAPIGMALVAPDGRWLKVNRTLCALTGYSEEHLLGGVMFQDITHPDDLDADLEHIQRLLDGEADRYSMEKRYFTAGGSQIWVNLSVSLVRDQAGQPLHFISQIEDISERKNLEGRLQQLADYDPLTEVWNRRRFTEELQHQVHRCQRYGERAALLMIDLNRFKSVNDTHGHLTGDALLGLVASRMRNALRTSDALARIGGDEFAVILPNISRENAELVSGKLREVIVESLIAIGDTAIGVDASVGIEMLDERTPDLQAAMAGVDAAMYAVKRVVQQPVGGR